MNWPNSKEPELKRWYRNIILTLVCWSRCSAGRGCCFNEFENIPYVSLPKCSCNFLLRWKHWPDIFRRCSPDDPRQYPVFYSWLINLNTATSNIWAVGMMVYKMNMLFCFYCSDVMVVWINASKYRLLAFDGCLRRW